MFYFYFYIDMFLLICFFVNIWFGKSFIIGFYFLFMDILCFNQVVKVYNVDFYCVDWNVYDENFILIGYLFFGFGCYEFMKILVFYVLYCRIFWINCV